MKKIKVWNGTDSINGVSADEILNRREDIKNNIDDVFLVMDSNNHVIEIQFGKVISSNFNMDSNLTLYEIGEQYLQRIQYEEEIQEKERLSLEEANKKISILEAENEQLKIGLKAVLAGDMQTLAYILYPDDFIKI